jgi:hypothetical protein
MISLKSINKGDNYLNNNNNISGYKDLYKKQNSIMTNTNNQKMINNKSFKNKKT